MTAGSIWSFVFSSNESTRFLCKKRKKEMVMVIKQTSYYSKRFFLILIHEIIILTIDKPTSFTFSCHRSADKTKEDTPLNDKLKSPLNEKKIWIKNTRLVGDQDFFTFCLHFPLQFPYRSSYFEMKRSKKLKKEAEYHIILSKSRKCSKNIIVFYQKVKSVPRIS